MIPPSLLTCHQYRVQGWFDMPGRMPPNRRWHDPRDEQEASACAGSTRPPAAAAAPRPVVSKCICPEQASHACLRLDQSCRGETQFAGPW